MIKKILILATFTIFSFANEEFNEAKELFNEKCSSCHKGYISVKKLKENFFEKKNKLLNITIPTENMLSYAIMKSPKKIGNENDADFRQVEIEEYLRSYLANPDRMNSVCDPHLLKYYDKKEPIIIDEDEASMLAYFFMNYDEQREKSTPQKSIVLTNSIDEKEILDKAIQANKYILVLATAEDCYFCKKMKKEVLDHQNVQNEIYKNYIFVEVDVEITKLPFNLNKHYKKITPSFFVLDNEGNFLNGYPGSWSKEDFLGILKENL